MKQRIFYILILLAGMSSCKKTLTDNFYNPDQLSEGVTDLVPGLFTQTVTTNKIFVQDYGEWFYLLNDGLGPTGYAQIAQRYISTRYTWFTAYNDLTTGNGFDDFCITGQGYFEASYERLKSWETVKELMDSRSGQDKANAMLYYKLLTVVKDYQAAKLVDFFNSIPYFNAFKGTVGGTQYYLPAYDDPKAIYEDIITDLGHLVDSLPGIYAAVSPQAISLFNQQDEVFGGNISSWVQFANFLRLKYLVRIADVDGAFAKQYIPDVLSKPLPATDQYWHLWYLVDPTGGGVWQRGLYENTYASFIPNIIMKR
ncbi:MAG: SusD/RagB family nutrient-binding outer membrane lipoprotein, partial [Chitinophaga rupis]